MALVNGVVVGIVTAVDVGQVKLHFPWLDEKHETDWVRIATIMSGGGAGSFFMPNVQDEVLVAFQHGDTRFPVRSGIHVERSGSATRERCAGSRSQI